MRLGHRVWLLVLVLAVDGVLAFGLHGVWKQRSVTADSGDTAMVQEGRQVALTFDDGPDGKYTEKLLDGLKERGVKVTFFLVGKNIEGNEELVKRMSEEGHLIGTHCYTHGDLTKMPLEEACGQIIRTNQMIETITGRRPEYIRPPFGTWNSQLEDCVDMTPVYWDIDPLDWKTQNRQNTVRHVLKKVGKHEVILLHDVFEPSVDAALEIVDTLTDQGYTFVTIDEMLID